MRVPKLTLVPACVLMLGLAGTAWLALAQASWITAQTSRGVVNSGTSFVVIEVSIDIKPGSFPNSINLGNNGVIPVAVLSDGGFDATTVDPSTVVFAGASVATNPRGKLQAALEDVDGDGDLDLILHFRTQATNVAPGDIEACLIGQTFGGQQIEGCDSVRIVPPDADADGDSGSAASLLGDDVEASVGTDQYAGCGTGAWPPDINNDGRVNIGDVLQYKDSISATLGDSAYKPRLDLVFDGYINMGDVLVVGQYLLQTCAQ